MRLPLNLRRIWEEYTRTLILVVQRIRSISSYLFETQIFALHHALLRVPSKNYSRSHPFNQVQGQPCEHQCILYGNRKFHCIEPAELQHKCAQDCFRLDTASTLTSQLKRNRAGFLSCLTLYGRAIYFVVKGAEVFQLIFCHTRSEIVENSRNNPSTLLLINIGTSPF